MGQFSLSKIGEIPSTEVTQLAKATGIATMQPDQEYKNFMFLSAIGQRTAAGMGGGARVSTALMRFYERNFKEGGFGFGPGTDKNLRDVFEEATVQLKRNPTLAKGLGMPETQLLQLAGTHATGKTPQEQKQNLDKWIQSTLDLIETQDQLEKDYKAVSEVAENQLKAAFNDLTDEISTDFGPVIKEQIVPALKNFVKAIAENHSEFEQVGRDLMGLIKNLEDIAPLFGMVSEIILDFIAAIISVPGLLIEKLADELGKVMGNDAEPVKQIRGVGDAFMNATKGLVNFGAGLEKVTNDFNKINLGGAPTGGPNDYVAKFSVHRPPATIPYHGPGGGGASPDQENVRWMRQLVRTSIEGNVLMRQQNQKLDNINPPDPSRSGQANK
jgi:predicted RNase H-like HicB family nuclease